VLHARNVTSSSGSLAGRRIEAQMPAPQGLFALPRPLANCLADECFP